MQTPQLNKFKIIILTVLLNVFLLNGCDNTQNSQNNNNTSAQNNEIQKSNQSSDNIEDLLNIIRLPEIPEEVVWREETNANPKKIVAVLKFTAEELPNFLSQIENNKLSDSVEVGVENWFPEELKAQAQLSGEGLLKGTGYGAKEFYNIPYGSGSLTRIKDTNYFVLELTATS